MVGTAKQLYLGRQLRELRSAAGFSLDEVSESIERSRSTVGHWERGRSTPSAADLRHLLKLYKVDEHVSEHLHRLRRSSSQPGWWDSYKLPSSLEPFIGFESEAREVFHFELGLIPGLMQTAQYARFIHQVGRLNPTDAERNAWIDARMHRQERLQPGGGLTFHTVIAEEALRRIVGSHQIMVEQLTHLLGMAELPSVNLQILPFTAGAHVGSVGPITVLRFEDPAREDIAFSDTPLGGHVIDGARDVAELSRMFGGIQAQALPADESTLIISTIREDHAQHQE